jgi:hypothetical protein
MKRYWIVKGILFGVVAFFVFTGATMYLWNWLVPLLFHGPVIEFWQAFGLLVLGRLLFGGFGRGHCGGGRWRGHHHWRRHWQEKMSNMTPEQREELRKKWRARCGGWYDEQEQPAKEQ